MSWEPLNLASPEYEQPVDPPKYAGLLYEHKRHLITGPPESAKTIFAARSTWERTTRGIEKGVPGFHESSASPTAMAAATRTT